MKQEIPVVKNKEYVVEIIDNGYEGEGIAKIDNYTIFIPQAIKGEKVKILIVKVNTSHAFGKIIEILEESESRSQIDCDTYKRCGGCSLRHIQYKETLKMKQNMVQNLANKMLNEKIVVDKTIGMEDPYHYRNKAQYPVGYNKDNEIVTGIYANRSHDIIPMKQCFIQATISQEIVEAIIDFMKQNKITAYREETGKGLVRHIVIKVGFQTNEVMCILVINGKEIPSQEQLVKGLLEKFPQIKTIVKNVNMRNTNVILGKENITLYGTGSIEDKLGDYYFEISPLSFYQVNPIQTEKLYQTAINLAKLQKKDIALDLYCGIGTIGIFMANHVKKIYGVEIVEQAIENAKENAKRNNIENIEFLCGDVEVVLEELVEQRKVKPDIIFVDPPRKGLDNNTIQNIKNVMPPKVIYISCNPSTLMRDLSFLEEKYSVEKIQPVDMFPFTSHMECVAVLQLKQDR